MITAFLIILNHFIADFLLQNGKMATKKGTSIKWLTVHVCTYTCAIMPISISLDYQVYGHQWFHFNSIAGALFLTSNFILHWITDFFTSRLTGFLYKKHEADPKGIFLSDTWLHWFFVVIGMDQVIHYACLLFTYEFILNHIK